MRAPWIICALAVILATGALVGRTSREIASAQTRSDTAAISPESYVPGELIVELQPARAAGLRAFLDPAFRVPNAWTGAESIDRLNRKFRVREMRPVLTPVPGSPDPVGRTPLAGYFVLRLGEGQDAVAALAEYRADPEVRSAQLNYRYTPALVPNDPLYPQQWAHPKTSAPAGWDITTGQVTPKIVIAVIGQGIDLKSNLVPGYDLANNDSNPSAEAGETHETRVAGIAAPPTNNRKGVAGVCWGCGIMPIRTTLSSSGLTAAIDYAVIHGVRVVNISYSAPYPDSIMEASVNNADAHNVVVVASAGNNDSSQPISPAGFANTLSVGGTDMLDGRENFSSYGSWVDVSAPGDSLYTTTVGGNYGFGTGTSFSAPYVAGLAGLILSKNPEGLTAANVRHMIEYSADHITTDHFIGGRVNVQRALTLNGEPAVFATIKSPDASTILDTGPTDIFGTAVGTSYILEQRPQGGPSWTQFGSGSTATNAILGNLDATPLAFGRYDIRLTASSGASQDQHTITVLRSGTYANQTGWPVVLGKTGSVGSAPLYADIDGNGSLDVAVSGAAGLIGVWSANGARLLGWPRSAGTADLLPVAVGKIAGTGTALNLVVASTTGMVYAFNFIGQTLAPFPLTMDSAPAGPPLLANLDSDPALEIVAVSVNGTVYVWNGDGTTLGPAWPKSLGGPVDAAPAVGDVDGDGVLDIIVRQTTQLDVFKADGTAVGPWPVATALPSAGAAPVVGDIDGDSNIDIVETEQQPGALSILAYRGNGTLLWRHDNIFGHIMNGLSLGDIDNDGKLETVVTDDGGTVTIFDSLGNSNWFVRTEVGNHIVGSAAIGDIDGDGFKDILVEAINGRLYGWNRNAALIFLTPNGFGGYGTPAIGDLDGDGGGEVIAGE
ncbi:MAG TPA: S8 family serine peptidase, partial [Candidatus Polarisedimenticolia bacterium]|nr:S8 family serine peptidase [Candidatus Polarisedimenticolia bacterium]